MEAEELRVILGAIDLGIREASTHYVEVQARALGESEERFRLLVANVKDYAIFMLDTGGHIVSWNRGAEHIKGYTADEVLGKHFSICYTQDDIRDGKPEQSLRKAERDERFEEEGLRVRKDGSTFFADDIATAVRDEAGTLRGFAKITRDITGRQALEAELHNRAARLTEMNRLKDEFLAMLGHELRNPLASITAAAEVLHSLPSGDTTIKQAQDIIGRQSKHLARLVDDLVDVARINEGKIELDREPVELKRLIEQVVETLRPFTDERQQSLAVSLTDTRVWLEADSSRLLQVLGNLLHNSAKFTNPGGRIDLDVTVDDREAVVLVRDTGRGIAPELLPYIFDVFTQGDHPHGESVSGLGIGLALVKRLVELHGGTVSARSEGEGKGSEFRVRLPIPQIDETTDPDDAANSAGDSLRSPKNILVVDDNVDAAESVAMLLRFYQHAVRIVHSGHDAVQAAIAQHPQVVLLDIGLPDMDGYEVARQLRARSEFKDVRLVALTGYGRERDKRSSMEAGFDTHLTKPASLAALQEAIYPESEPVS